MSPQPLLGLDNRRCDVVVDVQGVLIPVGDVELGRDQLCEILSEGGLGSHDDGPVGVEAGKGEGKESFLFSASDRAFFRSVSLMLWAERSPVTAESAERFSVLRPLVFRLYMFTCPVSSDMFMAGLPNSRPVPASKRPSRSHEA